MLPAVNESAMKSIGVGAFVPAGFVGIGEGASAGALRLVVAVIDVPLAIVVPLWKVMVEAHNPSVGKFAAVPSTKFDTVPVALVRLVSHGKVEVPAAGLLLAEVHPATKAAAKRRPNEAETSLLWRMIPP
jgi:hypothetical protein